MPDGPVMADVEKRTVAGSKISADYGLSKEALHNEVRGARTRVGDASKMRSI